MAVICRSYHGDTVIEVVISDEQAARLLIVDALDYCPFRREFDEGDTYAENLLRYAPYEDEKLNKEYRRANQISSR